jgi:tetratricopeptide (TPR) repeat protein
MKNKKSTITICIVYFTLLIGKTIYGVEFVPLEDGLCATRKRWKGGEGDCSNIDEKTSPTPKVLPFYSNENKYNSTLIVLVISARHHFEHRQLIRETWGSETFCKRTILDNNTVQPSTICNIFFVIGMPSTLHDKHGINNTKINEESKLYNDIIHVPVLDIYSNLIYKVLVAFDYIDTTFKYTFVLKADDDTYINLNFLLKTLLHPLHPRRKTLLGQIWESVPMRDITHKNYVSELYYPLNQLIPYPHGAHYILTSDFVKYIVNNEEMLAPSIIPPEFRGNLEDVRIGMWGFAIGMSYVHDIRFVESINCHSKAISISDVPLNLFKPIHKQLLLNSNWGRKLQGGADEAIGNSDFIISNMCIDELHNYAAEKYLNLAEIHALTKKDEKIGDALNNAAVHLAYISKFDEALIVFERADEIYKTSKSENKLLGNLNYLYNITTGEKACDVKCVTDLKLAIDKGLEKFASKISKP